MDKIFLIFGDSDVYGVLDNEVGGWAQRLKNYVGNKYADDPDVYCVFHVLGINGNTSADLLERFNFEARQRIKEWNFEEIIIIFQIGGNDSSFLKDKNSQSILPKIFVKNIGQLVGLARKITPKVFYLELSPVDESRTAPVSFDSNLYYRNELIERYNTILREICEKKKVSLIKINEEMAGDDFKKLLSKDGLHFNVQGHQRIFEIIKDYLEERKII